MAANQKLKMQNTQSKGVEDGVRRKILCRLELCPKILSAKDLASLFASRFRISKMISKLRGRGNNLVLDWACGGVQPYQRILCAKGR
jgi:hypothetical protein